MKPRLEVFDRVSDHDGADPAILTEHQRVRAVLFDGHVIEFSVVDPVTVEIRGTGHRATRLRILPNASNAIYVKGESE